MEYREHYKGEYKMSLDEVDKDILGKICIEGGNPGTWVDIKRGPIRKILMTNEEQEIVKYNLVEIDSIYYEIEAVILHHGREFKTILKTGVIFNEDLNKVFNETIRKFKLGEEI